MKIFKVGAIVIISFGFLITALFFLLSLMERKPGGILITSTPISSVYLNGSFVGKTPYEGVHQPGEYLLNLIPEDSGENYFPYQATVTVVPGVKTVIRQNLSGRQEEIAGEIVSLTKTNKDSASLVVFSDPSGAQIFIDEIFTGLTPYSQENLSLGEHRLVIKSPGYSDRSLNVNAISGYELTVKIKLKKNPEAPQVAAAMAGPRTLIEILTTPNGFLRVRSEPGAAGREIHQVKPGEKYLFLEEDAATGWFKIQIQAPAPGLPNGITGWVSNEYSRKIEGETSASNLPSQVPVTEIPE